MGPVAVKDRRIMAGCEKIQDELSAFLDGELSAAERARIQEHLKACAACQALLADLQTVQASLQEMPKLAAPAGLAASISEAVRADQTAEKHRAVVMTEAAARRKSFWHPGLPAVAALLVLGVLLFWVLPGLAHAPSQSAMLESQSPAAVAAPVTAKQKLERLAGADDLAPKEVDSAQVSGGKIPPRAEALQPLAAVRSVGSGGGGGAMNAAPAYRETVVLHVRDAARAETKLKALAEALGARIDPEAVAASNFRKALHDEKQSGGVAAEAKAVPKRGVSKKIFILHVPAERYGQLRKELDALERAALLTEKAPATAQNAQAAETAGAVKKEIAKNGNEAETPAALKKVQQAATASARPASSAASAPEEKAERLLRIEITE